MKKHSKIWEEINPREIGLFITFYLVSTLIYYTVTWVAWGAFVKGHPAFFDFREISASGGIRFAVSFLVTVPIWYILFVRMKSYSLQSKLLSHLIFLPVYVALTYFLNKKILDFFGWFMFFGGNKIVWDVYTFMLFYLVQFGFIHAYTYFKQFKKEAKEKVLLQQIAFKSEISALKAQVNPHFLHNLFNFINATISEENERTRELIVQLSDLFRYQNYAAQQEYVTLREEVDFIENYLQLMKIRLKERMNYHFEVTPELHDFKIAPMLLQPLVENAVNHGIAPKIESSSLLIKITKEANNLVFSIEDTGIGIDNKEKAFSKGVGLSNTKMRLNKTYNSDLIIEDNFPTGTKISFRL